MRRWGKVNPIFPLVIIRYIIIRIKEEDRGFAREYIVNKNGSVQLLSIFHPRKKEVLKFKKSLLTTPILL